MNKGPYISISTWRSWAGQL